MTKFEELRKQREELRKRKLAKDPTVTDPIYLMSSEEFERHKSKIPEWRDWWWLRTPDDKSNFVAYVDGDYIGGHIRHDDACVRPVLNENNLTIEDVRSVIFVDDDRMMFCGVTWFDLGDGLWVTETPIAIRRFDEKSNDYANSEVRQFLLDWYNERKDWQDLT